MAIFNNYISLPEGMSIPSILVRLGEFVPQLIMKQVV